MLRFREHLATVAAGLTRTTVLATVVCWALLGWRIGPDPVLGAYGYLSVVGVQLARTDIRERRLPDVLTLPAYPLTVALLAAATLPGSDSGSLVPALLGGAAMWAVYAGIRLAHPPAMGLGDVKLAGTLGCVVAWSGSAAWVLALGIAFGLAAAAAFALIALRHQPWKGAMAFGPFMLAGSALAILAS